MKSNFLKHDPNNTIATYIARARVNAEAKAKAQGAIDSAAESALLDSLVFFNQMNPQFPQNKIEDLKVVFSVVSPFAELRHDGEVQCMATKSTYAAAKKLADGMTIGQFNMRVVAQYVLKGTYIGD